MRLEVYSDQVERIAGRLVELGWQTRGFPALETALRSDQPEQLADFFFFNSALLFDFYGLEAEVNGQPMKGSDLFLALAGRKAEQEATFFTADRMANLDLDEYLSVYALDGDPSHSLINRPEERVTILRELGQGLLDDIPEHEQYEYLTPKLLSACDNYLQTQEGTGLLDRLDRFEGYNDPHHKKAFVWLKILDRLDLFHARDRQHLFIPVDYHLIRMALRTGIVSVTDNQLAQQLRQRAPATQDDDLEIRQVIKQAYKGVENASGVDVFVLDEIFWTIGRSCCHYSRPTRCTTCDFTDCSVMKSFDYQCPGFCPLSTVCLGAGDEDHRNLFEPNLVTTYY
jgi:hypothetical protein